jgi:monoterpene epsilon-lactone hydrolase
MTVQTDSGRVRHPPDGGAGPVPAAWFGSSQDEARSSLLYVHGGSFIVGRSPRITSLVARCGAGSGARVYVPSYRLAPEYPCPAAVEDIVAAYRWHRRRWPKRKLSALAESSGASILLAALQIIRDAGEAMPSTIVLLSPWVDLSLQSWSVVHASLTHSSAYTMDVLALMAHFYLQGRSASDPIASPLFGDFSDFPPMLINASKTDILYDDAVRLAEHVRAIGGDQSVQLWVEDSHMWDRAHSVRRRSQAVARIASFIRAQSRS